MRESSLSIVGKRCASGWKSHHGHALGIPIAQLIEAFVGRFDVRLVGSNFLLVRGNTGGIGCDSLFVGRNLLFGRRQAGLNRTCRFQVLLVEPDGIGLDLSVIAAHAFYRDCQPRDKICFGTFLVPEHAFRLLHFCCIAYHGHDFPMVVSLDGDAVAISGRD